MSYPETHQWGFVSIENLDFILDMLSQNVERDFGLQVAEDGRVWVCINGIAFIRFSPHADGRMQNIARSIDNSPETT